jgi:hypothetical protein
LDLQIGLVISPFNNQNQSVVNSVKKTLMKKLLVTTALCVITVASAMAQGRINFVNSSATGIRISNNADGSASLLLGTASTATFGIGPASTRVQLFAGLSSGSLAPVLIGSTFNLTSVTNSGSLIATAQGTFSGGANLQLAGFDGTAPVFLRFTATSINGLYAGVSPIIQVNLATGSTPSTTVFVAGAQGTASTWNGITMTPVPEPSSMALAGLGAASLLIFRRRK